MEEKDEENDKKSQQSQRQSRSKQPSEVEVSDEAEENAEAPRSGTESSVKYTLSHNSNVVAAPSIPITKSPIEKSKSNTLSPAKVSIKTTEENEESLESLPELLKDTELDKESPISSRQLAAAPVVPSGNGGGGVVASAGGGGGVVATRSGRSRGAAASGNVYQNPGPMSCAGGLLQKRSPFIHNPPYPEERRARIQSPRTPIEYIINLREDLADFQESHGLPRTRDYSFVSLGLALAQETGRAILSVFQMFTELFPILAIVSLILRFALDKLIEILETTDTLSRVKKSIVFALEMVAIMIPLWILFATIIIPLTSLILSLFKRVLRIKGGKKKPAREKTKMSTCTAN